MTSFVDSQVPTVDPRPRPPPAPPHVLKLQRVMNGENPSLSERVVRSVLATCREIDHNARLVSMTKDTTGETHLRVRAGDVHSVESLRRALVDAMPLSHTMVQESWADGTLEAEVTVPTADEEYRLARRMVTTKRLFQYWIAIATILVILGFGEWAAAIQNRRYAAAASVHDEL